MPLPHHPQKTYTAPRVNNQLDYAGTYCDVISNKINKGLNDLIAMHQEAYDFVRQFTDTDEGKRVRQAVSQNIEAAIELKKRLKEIIYNIKTL